MIITAFAVLVMIVGSAVAIVSLLYYRSVTWINEIVKSSILLNYQIMSEGGALSVQDAM